MHDLVIRNAAIADGLGGVPFRADLAVAGGLIAGIGHDLGAAHQVIDAEGLVLAPGIIDGHTHYDAQITWDPYADPSPSNGVTTAVIGNCGFTIAPCRPGDRDLIMRNLTRVEGMSLEALRAGITWEFESFAEYLAMLERQGVGLNIAAYAGHSAMRTYVMGAEASRRAATADEISAMQQLVRDAMAAGAVGFATSTSESHNGDNGVPMPSRLADDAELRALVNAMSERGGVFMLTRGTMSSIPYLESIAAESHRPVLIAALFHSQVNPDGVFAHFRDINAARARGHKVFGQVSCTPVTMDFTLTNPYCFESLPAWKPAMSAQGAALRAIYADAAFRAAVKADLIRWHGQLLFNGEWEKMKIAEVADPANRHLEGRAVGAEAAAAGCDPLDWFLDFALAEDLATQFTAELFNTDEAGVGRLIADPHSHVSLSDAGAHLTFFCEAGFGLHLIGHWVRERGVLTVGEAVRKLTSQPAAIFGMADRGRLAPGYAADLMLFDPATIARGERRRVNDLPAGAARLRNDARGLHGVWVNGVRVVDASGALRPARPPGKVLRRFSA